ncbi:hypothetical protein LX32DRAFT_440086 [Colletotrichum zoysiae]|uniref:Uncharacterized protein n=1 Tax=Colletotrichum zoysiae TaxID=1216348 RepID=A0AAD9HE54_9PEZI|nr:hypothetical protein LX32DRAFT_440086 [Colletotrichum zoysiae]
MNAHSPSRHPSPQTKYLLRTHLPLWIPTYLPTQVGTVVRILTLLSKTFPSLHIPTRPVNLGWTCFAAFNLALSLSLSLMMDRHIIPLLYSSYMFVHIHSLISLNAFGLSSLPQTKPNQTICPLQCFSWFCMPPGCARQLGTSRRSFRQVRLHLPSNIFPPPPRKVAVGSKECRMPPQTTPESLQSSPVQGPFLY